MSGADQHTRYEYDANDRLIKRTDPAGVVVQNLYISGTNKMSYQLTALGNIVAYEYDNRSNNVLKESLFEGPYTALQFSNNEAVATLLKDKTAERVTSYNYNEQDQLTSEETVAGSNNISSSRVYNALGQLAKTTNANGQSVYFFYDAEGELSYQVSAEGGVTGYQVNAFNEVVTTTQYANAIDLADITTDTTEAELQTLITASSNDAVQRNVQDKLGRTLYAINAKGDVVEYRYDANGNRIQETQHDQRIDLNSVALTKEGITAAFADVDQSEIRHTYRYYDQANRETYRIDHRGVITAFSHEVDGQIVTETEYVTVLESQTRPTQEALDAHIAANGDTRTITRFSYNLSDVLVSREVAGDDIVRQETYGRNSNGQLTHYIDAEGYRTSYDYDEQGRLIKTQKHAIKGSAGDSEHDQISYRVLDALGRAQYVIDGEGYVTGFTYDDLGQVLTETRYRTAITPEQLATENFSSFVSSSDKRTQTNIYDDMNRLMSSMDHEGLMTEYQYDVFGQLTHQEVHRQGSDINRDSTRWSYDVLGRRTQSTDIAGNTTLYYYNERGQLEYRINSLGEVTVNQYDHDDDMVSQTLLATRIDDMVGLTGGDVNDALLKKLVLNAEQDRTITADFDQYGQRTELVDGEGYRVGYGYNAFGELTSETRVLEKATQENAARTTETRWSYDKVGNRTQEIRDVDGLNFTRDYQYDAFRRQTQVTENGEVISRSGYDRNDRQTSQTDGRNGTVSTQYDAYNRVLSRTDALGHTTEYSYDDVARSITMTTAEGVTTKQYRNAHGDVVRLVDAYGRETTYQYDKVGNLTSQSGPSGDQSWSYDARGNVTRSTDIYGTLVTYQYDSENRLLTRIEDPAELDGVARAGARNLETTYQYTAFGEQLVETDSRGVTTTYGYDRKGRMLTQTEVDGGGRERVTEYVYSGAGDDRQRTDAEGAVTRNHYDNLGRLIAEENGLGGVTRYVYDKHSRVILEVGAEGAVTRYSYDLNGNRLSEVEYATAIDTSKLTTLEVSEQDVATLLKVSGADQHTRYEYDANDRLIKTTAPDGTVTTSVYKIGEGYQLVDNLTSDRAGREILDSNGRVLYQLDNEGRVTAYRYDSVTTQRSEKLILGGTYSFADLSDKNSFDQLLANANVLQTERTSYNNQGQVLTTGLSGGGLTQRIEFSYNSLGQLASRQDERGATEFYFYSDHGDRDLTVDPRGKVTYISYNERGEAVETRELANAINMSSFIANPTRDALLAALELSGSDQITYQAYDLLGRTAFVVNALGDVMEYRYDANGNRIQTLDYDKRIDVAATAISKGGISAALNTLYAGDFSNVYNQRSVFDSNNRELYRLTSDGRLTEFTYEADGQLIREIQYKTGNASLDGITRQQISDQINTSDADRVLHYAYDKADRLVQTIDGEGAVVDYQYNDFGERISKVERLLSAYLPASEQRGEELLKNPGAEEQLEHWNVVSGEWQTKSSNPTAVEGNSYFSAGQSLNAEISQSVDLSGYSFDIENNQIGFAFSGMIAAELSYDRAKVIIEFINSDGDVLSTWDSGEKNSNNSWIEVSSELVAPKGTSTANIRLQSRRLSWPTNDAYFDKLSFKAIGASAEDRLERYVRDDSGMLKYQVMADGSIQQFEYDQQNRLIATHHYASVKRDDFESTDDYQSFNTAFDTYYSNLKANRPDSLAQDQSVYRILDGFGRPQFTIDGEGYVTERQYDSAGNVVKEIQYSEALTSQQIKNKDLSSLSTQSGYRVTSRQFDALNRLIKEISSDGKQSEYEYNALGQRVAQVIRSKGEELASARITRWTYDRAGNLETIAGGNATAKGYLDTTFEYDGAGRQISMFNGKGAKSLFYYDAQGRMTYQINALGEVVAFVYNEFGEEVDKVQLAARIAVEGLSGGAVSRELLDRLKIDDAKDSHSQTRYNKRGEVIETIDGEGYSVGYSYNAFGELISEVRVIQKASDQVEAKTVVSTYSYDQRGNQIRRSQDVAGINLVNDMQYDVFGREITVIESGDLIKSVIYDRNGRVVETSSYLSHSEKATDKLTYDAFGRILTKTTANGAITQYSYDDQNRIVTVTTPDGIVTSTQQNAFGERVEISDNLGRVIVYKYDNNGNLIETDDSLEGLSSATYDKNNNKLVTTDFYGEKIEYEYDVADRVLIRKETDTGAITEFGYDAKNQLIREVSPSGLVTEYSYSRNGNIVRELKDPQSTRQVTEYQYDGLDNRLSVAEGYLENDNSIELMRHSLYQFDKLGRRIAEIQDPDGSGIKTEYNYDNKGNVISVSRGNNAIVDEYRYDLAGRKTHDVNSDGSYIEYKYDVSGNITETKNYSEDGSLYANNFQYFDINNRLILKVGNDGYVTRYWYDKQGNKIQERAYGHAASELEISPGLLSYDEITEKLDLSEQARNSYYYFDLKGQERFRVDPSGYVVEQNYNERGDLTLVREYRDRVDVNSRISLPELTKLIESSVDNRTAYRIYDMLGRQRYEIDAGGYVTENRYDSLGQKTEELRYDTPVSVYDVPSVEQMEALLKDKVFSVQGNFQTEVINSEDQQGYKLNDHIQATNRVWNGSTFSISNSERIKEEENPQPYSIISGQLASNINVIPESDLTLSVFNNNKKESPINSYSWGLAADTKTEYLVGEEILPVSYAQLDGGISFDAAALRLSGRMPDSISTLIQSVTYVEGSAEEDDSYEYQDLYTVDTPRSYEITRVDNTDPQNPVRTTESVAIKDWNNHINIAQSTQTLADGNYRAVVTLSGKNDDGSEWQELAEVDFFVGDIPQGQPYELKWQADLSGTSGSVDVRYRKSGSDEEFRLAGSVEPDDLNGQPVSSVAFTDWVEGESYEVLISYATSSGLPARSIRGTVIASDRYNSESILRTSGRSYDLQEVGGISLDKYLTANDVDVIESVTATLIDKDGNLISAPVVTRPAEMKRFDPHYNGSINLSDITDLQSVPLNEDRTFNIKLDYVYRDGRERKTDVIGYQVAKADQYYQSLTFDSHAVSAAVGDQVLFSYRPQDGAHEYINQTVNNRDGKLAVNFERVLSSGNYEYLLLVKNSDGQIKSRSNGLFVGSPGEALTHNNQVEVRGTSATENVGSSLSGYLKPADLIGLNSVSVSATNLTTGEQFDEISTYINASEVSGTINLSRKSLTDGQYAFAINLVYEDGSTQSRNMGYQVGTVEKNIDTITYDLGGLAIPRNSILEVSYNNNDIAVVGEVLGNRYLKLPVLSMGDHDITVKVVDKKSGGILASYSGEALFDSQASSINITVTNKVTTAGRNFYDIFGRVKYSQDAEGYVSEFSYDAIGQKVSEKRYSKALVLAANANVADVARELSGLTADENSRTRVLAFAYDKSGRLIGETDALGNQSVMHYDNAGQLTSETDRNGNTSYNFYNQDGEIVRRFSPVSVIASNDGAFSGKSYASLVNSIENIEGYVVDYEYDVFGNRILEKKYLEKSKLINAAADNGKSSIVGVASISEWEYDLRGNITAEHKSGNTTRYEYDAYSNQIGTTLAAGSEDSKLTKRYYDERSLLLKEVINEGGKDSYVVNYTYDQFGRKISRSDQRLEVLLKHDSQWAIQQRTKLNVAKLSADLSNTEKEKLKSLYTTYYQYDGNNNLIVKTEYNENTAITVSDAFGNIVKTTDKQGNQSYFYYNAIGNLKVQVGIDGSVVSYEYDAAGNQTLSTTYGDKLTSTDLDEDKSWQEVLTLIAPNADKRSIEFVYDGNNQLIEERNINDGTSRIYGYDASGNRVTVTDARGNTTFYLYDARNQLIGERTPLVAAVGGSEYYQYIEYLYDALGYRTASMELGSVDAINTEYDLFGRTLFSEQADGRSITYQYDGRGNIVSETNGNGYQTQHIYDKLDRRIYSIAQLELSGDARQVTEFRYDPQGSLLQTLQYEASYNTEDVTHKSLVEWIAGNTGRIRTQTNTFDLQGRVESNLNDEVQLYSKDKGLYLGRGGQSFKYTDNGLQTLVKDGNGNSTHSFYNQNNELILQIDAGGYVTSLEYDGYSNVEKETLYAASLPDYIRDLIENRDTSLVQNPDLVETIMAAMNKEESDKDRVTIYTYDSSDRVLTKRVSDVSFDFIEDDGNVITSKGDQLTKFVYDENGNLIQQQQGIVSTGKDQWISRDVKTEDFSYDRLNRLILKSGDEFDSFSGKEVRNRSKFAYDFYGNVIWEGVLDGAGTVKKSHSAEYTLGLLKSEFGYKGEKTYRYDDNGNVTHVAKIKDGKIDSETRYGYDASNRVTSTRVYEDSHLTEETHVRYNAFGEIEAKGRNNVDTEFYVYDLAGNLTSTNKDGSAKAYLYDGNGNATLQIASANVDLKGVDIATVLSSARTEEDQFNITVNQYDELNRLIAEITTSREEIFEYMGENPDAAEGTERPAKNIGSASLLDFNVNMEVGLYARTDGSWRPSNKLKSFRHKYFEFNWDQIPQYNGQIRIDISTDYHFGERTTLDSLTSLPKTYYADNSSGKLRIETNVHLERFHRKDLPKPVFDYNYTFSILGEDGKWHGIAVDKGVYHWTGRIPRAGKKADNTASNSTQVNTDFGQRLLLKNQPGDTTRIKFFYEVGGKYKELRGAPLTGFNSWSVDMTTVLNDADLANGNSRYYYEAYSQDGKMVGKGQGMLRKNTADGTVSESNHVALDVDLIEASSIASLIRTNNLWHGARAETQVFDRFGNVISSTDGRGNTVNADGTLEAINIAVAGKTVHASTKHFEYSNVGQLLSSREANAAYVDNNLNTVQTSAQQDDAYASYYYYDGIGRRIGIRDAMGSLTQQTWADDKIASTTDALGGEVTYQYDALDDLRRITKPAASGVPALTTNYSYNYGQRDGDHSVTTSGSSIIDNITRNYDVDGRVEKVQRKYVKGEGDHRDVTETYSYDALGRVTEKVIGDRSTNYQYSINDQGGFTTQTNDKGDISHKKTDYFGRTVQKTDIGEHKFTFEYDKLGQLSRQYSLDSNGKASPVLDGQVGEYTGQNIFYDYYSDGSLKSVDDLGVNSFAEYAYDKAGNRTWESYYSLDENGFVQIIQEANARYDEQNRLIEIKDAQRFTVRYRYDKNDNQVYNESRVLSHAGIQGSFNNGWYRYDALNRAVTANAVRSGSELTLANGSQKITYDNAGRRTSIRTKDDYTTYQYDNYGHLKTIHINGKKTSERTLAKDGTIVAAKEWGIYKETKTRVVNFQVETYDVFHTAKIRDEGYQYNQYGEKVYVDNREHSDAYSRFNYDNKGVLNTQVSKRHDKNAQTTSFTYEKWDGYKQRNTRIPYESGIKKVEDTIGLQNYQYDANGNVMDLRDATGRRTFNYVTDINGQVLSREQKEYDTDKKQWTNKVQNFFYFNGATVGEAGDFTDVNKDYVRMNSDATKAHIDSKNIKNASAINVGQGAGENEQSANFTFGFAGLSPYTSSIGYTTSGDGETAKTIAQAVYGDGSLWYVIAEANGLSGAESLPAGTLLQVPETVYSVKSTAQNLNVAQSNTLGNAQPLVPEFPQVITNDWDQAIQIGITIIIEAVAIAAAVVAAPAGPLASAAVYGLTKQVGNQAAGRQDGWNLKQFAYDTAMFYVMPSGSGASSGSFSTIAKNALISTASRQATDHAFYQLSGGDVGNDFTWKGFITDTLAAGATASLGEITKDIGFADGVTDVLGDAGFSVTMTAANQFVSETIRRNTFGSYDAHKETGLNFIERTLQSSGLKAAKTAGEALGQQALRGIFGDDKADKYFGDYEDSRKQSSLLERVYDLSDDYFTEKQPANSLEASQMTSQAALKQPDNRVANVSDNNQVRQQIALQNAYLNGNLGLAEGIRLDGRSSGEMSTDFVDLDSVAEPYEYEGLTPEAVATRSEAGLREAIAYSEAAYQRESDNSAQSQGSVTGQQIRYPGMTPIDLNTPLGDQYNEPVPVNTDIDVRAAIALSSETRMNESLGAIGENFVNGSSYLDSLGINTEAPTLSLPLNDDDFRVNDVSTHNYDQGSSLIDLSDIGLGVINPYAVPDSNKVQFNRSAIYGAEASGFFTGANQLNTYVGGLSDVAENLPGFRFGSQASFNPTAVGLPSNTWLLEPLESGKAMSATTLFTYKPGGALSTAGEFIGKGSIGVGAAISGGEAAYKISQEYQSSGEVRTSSLIYNGTKVSTDLAMSFVGLAWPVGTVASLAYFGATSFGGDSVFNPWRSSTEEAFHDVIGGFGNGDAPEQGSVLPAGSVRAQNRSNAGQQNTPGAGAGIPAGSVRLQSRATRSIANNALTIPLNKDVQHSPVTTALDLAIADKVNGQAVVSSPERSYIDLNAERNFSPAPSVLDNIGEITRLRAGQRSAGQAYLSAYDSKAQLQQLNGLITSGKATGEQKLAYHNALVESATNSKAAAKLGEALHSSPESLGVHVTGPKTKAAYQEVIKGLGKNIETSLEAVQSTTRELKVEMMSPIERKNAVHNLIDSGLRHDGKGYVINAPREQVKLTQTILNREGYGSHDAKGNIQPLKVDGGFGRISTKRSPFTTNTAKAVGHFVTRDGIEHHAALTGMSPAFASALADRESGFRIDAQSDTGVRGLFQITKVTAEEMGIYQSEKNRHKYLVDGVGPLLDGRNNPELSTAAGIGYLAKQVRAYSGDAANELENLKFAAAAYNKGRGAINKLLKSQFAGLGEAIHGGNNRHWDNLLDGVSSALGESREPVVIPNDDSTKEVYSYVRNIFYSDHESGVKNGGRYNYYQQLYKNRN